MIETKPNRSRSEKMKAVWAARKALEAKPARPVVEEIPERAPELLVEVAPKASVEPVAAPAPEMAASAPSTPETPAQWHQNPLCLCGCGGAIPRKNQIKKQSLFRPGHDARVKSLATRIVAGTAKPEEMPAIAKVMREHIGFLNTRPELAPAFN